MSAVNVGTARLLLGFLVLRWFGPGRSMVVVLLRLEYRGFERVEFRTDGLGVQELRYGRRCPVDRGSGPGECRSPLPPTQWPGGTR
jgi:hypothetical protein